MPRILKTNKSIRVTDSDGEFIGLAEVNHEYEEAETFNGQNHISVPTGSQWEHERLCKTNKGNYILEEWSQRQGGGASATLLNPREAAKWLMQNGHALPKDLAHNADELTL